MMRAVHLSAMRSSTMREGHCGFRTDAPEDFMSHLSDESSAAQAESNEPKRVYAAPVAASLCEARQRPKIRDHGAAHRAAATGLRSREFARTICLLMRQGDALPMCTF